MKSAEAFKRTYGGGYHRIDVADGFTFDPNKHSAATITLTDSLGAGALHVCVSAADGSQVSNASYFKSVSLA